MQKIRAKLRRVQNTVNIILQNHPETRDDDDLLYIKVVESVNPSLLDADFEFVMRQRHKFSIPSYNSVSRCRRKAQEEYPELASSIDVQLVRDVLEDEYRGWSKNE